MAEVGRRFDEMVDLTASLVRINTVNPYSGDDSAGLEKAGQEFLARELEKAGAAVEFVQVPPDIYEQCGVLGPRGRSWKGRPNVVGWFQFPMGTVPPPGTVSSRSGRKSNRGQSQTAGLSSVRTLILNCHIDTVGNDGYEGDPFSAEVRDGKLWGRGSSDAKGNLAIGLVAIKAVAAVAGKELSGRVAYESVVDEECNGAGAGTMACIKAGVVGDGCLALDGGGQCPYRGCNGVATPQVEVIGRSGHSAFGAVNAIDKLLLVKTAVDAFRERRGAIDPPQPVNIGLIRGGTLPAIVPQRAVMQYNVNYRMEDVDPAGPTPGAAVMREFERVVTEAADADPWLREHRPKITWLKDAPPYRIPDDLPIVRLADQAYKDVLGSVPHHKLLAWGDAAHFWNLARIPVIGMGGTTAGTAHSSCEYVELDGMLKNAKAVALAVYRFLVG